MIRCGLLFTALILLTTLGYGIEGNIPLTTGTMTLEYKEDLPEPADEMAGCFVTLKVKDADLGEVIRVLARRFRLNILFPHDFKTTQVTASFENVPLSHALRALLKTGGYDYIHEHNIYRIWGPNMGSILQIKVHKGTLGGGFGPDMGSILQIKVHKEPRARSRKPNFLAYL